MKINLPAGLFAHDEARKVFSEQVYYLDSSIEALNFDGDGVELTLTPGSIESEELTAKVLKLAEKTAHSFTKVRMTELFRFDGKITNHEDPFPHLSGTRQVVENAPGIFVYQGEFLKILRTVDHVFYKYALEHGALDQDYPSTVPVSSLMANGYLSGFPQHALLVSRFHSDLESIEGAATVARSDEKDPFELKPFLQQPEQVLAPTVCYHCFESLRDYELPGGKTEFTAIQKCHRYEAKNTVSLERLQTYTMREIIFFGAKEYVQQRRTEILEHAQETLSDWGLTFRVLNAYDPFFATESEKKRTYQNLMGLKIELQAYLPHSDKWISVASFNSHLDTLVNSYGISSGGDEKLFSGCVGYGYERLVYSIYSQFGADVNQWPDKLKNLIQE